MKRELDYNRMNQAKERSIEHVMEQIQPVPKTSIFKSLFRPAMVPILSMILIIALVLSPGNETTTIPSAFESEKLAEISYISTSLFASSITVSDTNFQKLSLIDETAFESQDDAINLYFDTLKVFLEDSVFTESIVMEELTDSEYDYSLTFQLDDLNYTFYLTITEEDITGLLNINDVEFTVDGTIEDKSNEFAIKLNAYNGDDYVSIEYKTESKDEEESKYEIESSINGVTTLKEVKITKSDNEDKVEIKENNNEYELKRELEDGEIKYKLEYKINGTQGEATIVETVDNEGVTTYAYQIEEAGVSKEITKGRPAHSYKNQGNQQNDNPSNNNGNNEEDNPSENGKGNGKADEKNPNNQNNTEELPKYTGMV